MHLTRRLGDSLKSLVAISGDPMPWKSVMFTLLAVAVPPAVAGTLLGRAAIAGLIAAMSAHLAAKDVGIGIAGLIVTFTGLAGFVALGAPEMALLVTPVIAGAAGAAGSYGLARPVIRGLIFWTIFTSTLMPAERPEALFVTYFAAMAWSLAVTRLAGLDATLPKEEPESHRYAAVFGVVFATGLTISVYVSQNYFGRHGFWFPLTFVALCLPPHGALFSRTLQRGVGTLVGTGIAFAIALVLPGTWWIAGVGAIALPLGFRVLPASYTGFITLLTVAILCFLDIASDIDTLAFERVATMAAAAAMTLGLAMVGALALYLVKPEALKSLQES
ncbi:FUSC family protein [Aurantimonas sp. VKM B-3413]|uniref:FUSC family protein n=1 Tax=Aurantimonas sp. VKM B-3413 TaxID=2779401 RepID=UPI001E53A6A4|nr:FUSC family protein [Aurantimonas sp. VKM B-3413]MCB8836534.1 FUSC family protein [Aurantimonas sp. VKM B-3413]